MNYFRMTTAVLAIVVFSGCTKKPELAPISGWVQYHDPYFQGTFSYPQGWHIVVEGTKVSMYSSQEAVGKFFD
ncbi:MAG TPA: hypothetical protein VNN76_11460, partial [Bacteroidota bacterium]|nr:hypothetical protein [Bacteroidota bacterium]